MQGFSRYEDIDKNPNLTFGLHLKDKGVEIPDFYNEKKLRKVWGEDGNGIHQFCPYRTFEDFQENMYKVVRSCNIENGDKEFMTAIRLFKTDKRSIKYEPEDEKNSNCDTFVDELIEEFKLRKAPSSVGKSWVMSFWSFILGRTD